MMSQPWYDRSLCVDSFDSFAACTENTVRNTSFSGSKHSFIDALYIDHLPIYDDSMGLFGWQALQKALLYKSLVHVLVNSHHDRQLLGGL